ncbi:hypothetical protein E3P77_00332 [Wallemia ichthyophaga]|uniref:Translin-associated protein X n=1 Tax=Wallemia ichthyophaga TaxID=245174 RepID=A0A4V4LXG8_WALIC|nr:hypothetical protein E3P98_00301 [Wallemia ichthyophaga]TIB05144.1 hypothetical protein E3P96_01386 [Wallemia ichthyophaga]TIB32680.1 hypothetical protein E3P86_03106 [Wallemia ichthyophaga]TIB69661.1 hypothetical protein E3P77_00332 [Wallemia ichthyophaga]
MSTRSQRINGEFESIKHTVDQDQDKRERVIKASRDITALSKRMIFSLHRVYKQPRIEQFNQLSSIRNTQLTQIHKIWVERVAVEFTHSDPIQRSNIRHSFSKFAFAGLEEYIEAISFLEFLESDTLITVDKIQLMLSVDNQPIVPVRPLEYLAGLGDLTGELMRMAIQLLGMADLTLIERIVELITSVKLVLQDNTHHFHTLQQKLKTLENSLKKIEDTRYMYEVRRAEFKDNPEALKRVMEHYQTSSEDSRHISQSN